MQTPSATHETPSARLVVCEKSGRWGAQLRRLLPGASRWINETRSVSQWLDALCDHPASLCAVEVTLANFDQAHATLSRVGEEFPLARTVIVSDEISADEIWALRETGAIHVVDALRRLDSIAPLWHRHAEQFPPRAATEIDRVLASLPWSE